MQKGDPAPCGDVIIGDVVGVGVGVAIGIVAGVAGVITRGVSGVFLVWLMLAGGGRRYFIPLF